ncbi:MAG: hypothetical protein GX620_12050 [Chloroflexi bacterium]|nr:hypothetical protein [Chloroflexota bacterium]
MMTHPHSNRGLNDPYFTAEDYAAFTEDKVANPRFDKDRQKIRDKFLHLHEVLYPEIRRRGWELHPHWYAPNIVSTWYIGWLKQIWFMKLRYLRSGAQVQDIESRMGMPRPLDNAETQYTKHPMLDIRLDSEYLAIELLLTDQAWWDAQNLKNKISCDPKAQGEFITILHSLGHDYVFGGWPDSSRPDLITTAVDLARGDALEDWLSRFEPGYDWLRLGIWYSDKNDYRLSKARVVQEILYRFEQLYTVYAFLLWTPQNDYRQLR